MGGNFENIKNLLVEYVSYEPDNYSYNCIGRKTSRNVNTNYLSCIHEMRNKYRELKEHIENLYRTALITLDVSYNYKTKEINEFEEFLRILDITNELKIDNCRNKFNIKERIASISINKPIPPSKTREETTKRTQSLITEHFKSKSK
jgi:hypothetical protein